MCGIAGLLLDELDPRGAEWLTRMTQRLVHRGPDDGGAVVFGHQGSPCQERKLGEVDEPVQWGYMPVRAGLGARRLAILDLTEAGHQPMSSSDGRVWLAFNGEIYNHATLRSQLAARGIEFRGHSDTEVLLAAYRAYGPACFADFEGMWAFAILDWGERKAYLCRDRLGIKPLYLARCEHGIAFASEIKSLLDVPGVPRVVNEARLLDFLSRGLVDHTDDTMFDGIWSVPSGCRIELSLNTRNTMGDAGRVYRYWQPETDLPLSDDPPTAVRETLEKAVASHLRSDVPVGSCLSGGLDSSAVVAMIDRVAFRRGTMAENWSQHTFTACLPDHALDESKYAEMVSDACVALQWHRVEPTAARLAASMESLVRHQEQPFGSPSIFMQWEVMRAARERGVKVLLDGQGGDELFCGYEGYLPPYLARLLRHWRLGQFVREFGHARRGHYAGRPLLKHIAAYLLPRRFRSSFRQGLNATSQTWLVGELFEAKDGPGMCETLKFAPPVDWRKTFGLGMFASHIWHVLLGESLPSLLRFEDRNSMAFGIEARVPMLDRPLVELAMSLRPEEKIRDGVLKAVLRDAVKDIVPAAILDRRDKIGFSSPTAEWLRGGLNDWWRDMLSSQSFRDRGCFSPRGVVKVVERFDQGDAAAALLIWRMAITEQWARQYLDKA